SEASRPVGGAQLYLGIECEQRRYPVGRGRSVAEIARYRCSVLNLDRPDLSSGKLQRAEGRRQGSGGNCGPVGQPTYDEAAFGPADAGHLVECGNVDDIFV